MELGTCPVCGEQFKSGNHGIVFALVWVHQGCMKGVVRQVIDELAAEDEKAEAEK